MSSTPCPRRSRPCHSRSRARIAPLAALALLSVVATLGTGCRFSVARVRSGTPLPLEPYAELETGESELAETLETMGAPDIVRWESGKTRLAWEYLDDTIFRARAQLPLALFGYRHDLFQYFQDRGQTSRIELVFDEDGTLAQKSLRLPEAYERAEGDDDRDEWRLQLAARAEHSFLVVGDADFADYDDIFADGPQVGAEITAQPVAPLTLGVAATAQEYPGRVFTNANGTAFDFTDLTLYTLEGRLRLQLPLRVFASIENLSNIWDLLLQDDPTSHDGWLLWAEGNLGVTLNSPVDVYIGGVRSGRFFDAQPRLSNSSSFGLEYSWRNVSLRTGITLRSTDGFASGDSPLPSDASSLQTLSAGLSLALKF